MNERLVLLASLYLTVAVALLHTSLAQTTSLRVIYIINNNNMLGEQVSLECFDSAGIIRDGARYTFMDPEGREESSFVAAGRSYEVTINPTNESLITCTLNNVESKPVRVVAIPRYTAGVRLINQYVYSDSAVADIECPFESGRLRQPVEISWSFVGSQGDRLGPIINATSGAYWLEKEDNRILHVNISTIGTRRYQCAGQVEICSRNTSCMKSMPSHSPTFVIMPMLDRLSVTEPPVNVTVDHEDQFESATFNCTATGSGDPVIEWTCSDGSNCDNIIMSSTSSSNNRSVTSTLVITGATSDLTVTCNVTRDLTSLTSGESAGVEVRLPPMESEQRTAQLIFMPVPTTVTTSSSDPPSTSASSSPSEPSSSPIGGENTIIILAIVLVFIITVIIILALCICCIFRYHYRNKESQLGQKLRRTFSRDPEAILQRYRPRESSPRQLDIEIQGTDTPPITCTAPDSTYVANGNNHLTLTGDQIYNTSQISGASGASSYSGMSGVSQNHGPHRMPRFGDPSHLGLPSGTNYPDHHSLNSRRTSDTSGSIHSGYSNTHQVPYYPTAIHSSHNVINQQPHTNHPDSTSLPGFQFIPSGYSTLPHVQQQQHIDPLSSLPILPHPSGAYVVYPQSQPLQPLRSERANSTLSSHSGNSHKGSGRQSPASVHSQHIQHPSPHMQPIPVYQPALQSQFISPSDLAVVQFALMHNRHCQIPGCCCQAVRELVEGNRGRIPYDSPEMSVSSSGSEKGSRVHRVRHQASSTDSDSDYSSYNDRRSRPPNLRLLSDEHNRNPNLHPHYHLTTKSHMRRVSVHAPVDHRRSKSLTDLTPLTEVPETPAKTPAIGGSVKAGTPVYYCPPTIGEDGQEKPTSPVDCHYTNQPMLLREISISADNIPALCLNDCPFTPSPLKEGCHMLAGAPSRRSFRRASMRSTKPKLKTVKEKSSSGESDDSNTSSRSNTPIKSSQSDDEGIDVQSHHSQELKSSSLHKHTKIPMDTTLTNKAPVDTAHQTLTDSAPKSSLGIESSHYNRSLDDEVKEIMQSAPARDIQKTAPSRSPLLGRKRNESTNSGYLMSNSNAMSDPRMRRSISPLSIGSSSQVSVHSRRSNSPYETEIRKQNGVVTEITEC